MALYTVRNAQRGTTMIGRLVELVIVLAAATLAIWALVTATGGTLVW